MEERSRNNTEGNQVSVRAKVVVLVKQVRVLLCFSLHSDLSDAKVFY